MTAIPITLAQLRGSLPSPPQGDTNTLADTAENLETLTQSVIEAATSNSVTAVESLDVSGALNISQALALEGSGLAVTVPSGDTATLTDTAADLLSLSPTELSGLGAVGVTAIVVNDDVRPLFSLSQEVGIAGSAPVNNRSLTVSEPTGAALTVSDLI